MMYKNNAELVLNQGSCNVVISDFPIESPLAIV